MKIENFFDSVLFEIRCLEVERLTDLHKLLRIFEEKYAEGRSIKEYVRMIDQEKDLLKKSELEMQACQYFFDLLGSERFFFYQKGICNMSEIYRNRRMNCSGFSFILYILLNRYLKVEHWIVETYYHFSNVVRLSNDYLAYCDGLVSLIKDLRKNEYLRKSNLTKSVIL